jgi:hypothetical protein
MNTANSVQRYPHTKGHYPAYAPRSISVVTTFSFSFFFFQLAELSTVVVVVSDKNLANALGGVCWSRDSWAKAKVPVFSFFSSSERFWRLVLSGLTGGDEAFGGNLFLDLSFPSFYYGLYEIHIYAHIDCS